MATRYKIHPSIGIARVGPSPEFFIGPEIPGVDARPPDGRYRDDQGQLRRQAARFWVFVHDDAEPATPPRAVLAGQDGVARIEWTVHLANKKAAWYVFDGVRGEGPQGYAPDHPLRNPHVHNVAERRRRLVIDPGPRRSAPHVHNVAERRRRLVIDPGPRRTDRAQRVEIARGHGGGYPETWPGPLAGGRGITSLGTMLTDPSGRLIVAGGYGIAGTVGSVPADGRLHYANNDHWFDDVADGPVTARVVFDDGTSAETTGAWLIVGPPDFAPPIENLVTVYDLLHDLAVRELGSQPDLFDPGARRFRPDYRPSFRREIQPLLRRAVEYRWVDRGARRHGAWMADFAALGAAPAPGEDPRNNPRMEIFTWLRDPDNLMAPEGGTMPRLQNDGVDGAPPETMRFTVTRTQYALLRQWAAGHFAADWDTVTPPPAEVTAPGLDRAALDAACGGSFFPGIEAGWILRDPRIYAEPFRFTRAVSEEDPKGLTPGDATKRSAVPWQADFLKCGDSWWPAQRPNQVYPDPAAAVAVPWDAGVRTHLEMVERWSGLGIVARAGDPMGRVRFHETERTLVR